MLSKRTTRSKSSPPARAIPTIHLPDNKKILPKDNTHVADHHPSDVCQFDDHYDDSSDETEINLELSQYDINQKWKDAQEKLKLNARNSLANDDLLSFVAHVAANKCLHSADVNKIYYPLKNKILNQQLTQNKASQQLQQRAIKAFIQSMQETLEAVKQFLTITNQKQFSPLELEKMLASVSSELIINVNAISLDKLVILIDWLRVDKLCCKEKINEKSRLLDKMNVFEQDLSQEFIHIFRRQFKLKKIVNDRSPIKMAMTKLLDAVVETICQRYHLDKRMHTKGRDETVEELASYNGLYRNVVCKLRTQIEACPATGKVHTMLNHKLEERGQREELTRAYLNDLIAIHRANSKMSADENIIFKQYFTFSDASVCDELADNFSIYLKNNLTNALKSFYRPTLGENYQFVSNNPYSFYANLRLSNRSQKRQILNKKYAFFKSDSVARTWKLNPTTRSAVVETQELSNGTLGRRDLVQGLGNYDKIYEDIAQVKDNLKSRQIDIDDQHITQWIRQAFKGISLRINYTTISDAAKHSIEDMIDRVSYLIHGCEGSRNIAMIIIIPMMLDLIVKGNEWTLEEALTGKQNSGPVSTPPKLMPMAPEGAVAAARTLERAYRPFTPHAYLYPGVEDRDGNDHKMSKDELVRFEARVVRAWINMQHGQQIKMPNQQLTGYLLSVIESHFHEWFDLNIDVGAKLLSP